MNKENKPNILLIGAGGTGGYLAPMLATITNTLIIADGDRYENKNRARQAFAKSRTNKAKVFEQLLDKYNVVAHPQMVNGSENFGQVDIIISCVDNNKARRAVRELADSHVCPAIICGNEDWDPMAFLYQPIRASDERINPYEKWGLENLQEAVVQCDGEIVEEVEQTSIANFAAGGLAMTILHSMMTFQNPDLWVAEAMCCPYPKYKRITDLINAD